MDKTCKSNADCGVAIFCNRSGALVRNTWVIYREVRDNSEKSELIPDVIAWGHPWAVKVGDPAKAGPDASR